MIFSSATQQSEKPTEAYKHGKAGASKTLTRPTHRKKNANAEVVHVVEHVEDTEALDGVEIEEDHAQPGNRRCFLK